jgi:hypothetical protein
MGTIDDLGQKVRGKLQKAKGNIQLNTSRDTDIGMKFKGGVSKVKGELNDSMASMKLRNRRPRRYGRGRVL